MKQLEENFFAAAKEIHPVATAPQDGTPIVARDDDGEVRLIKWRTHPDLEPDEEPYWAIWATDEEFEFVEWVPSPITIEEILKLYG